MNLEGCLFIMEGNSSIKVRNSSFLELSNCILQGCNYLWQGIELEDNSGIEIKNGSFISDARYAISNGVGSSSKFLDISNTTFSNNIIGIYSNANFGSLAISPLFYGNIFTCTRPLLGSPINQIWASSGSYSFAGIIIYDYPLIIGKVNASELEQNKFSFLQAGICAYNCALILNGTIFSNIPGFINQSNQELFPNIGVKNNIGVFNQMLPGGRPTQTDISGYGKDGTPIFLNVKYAIKGISSLLFFKSGRIENSEVGITLSGYSIDMSLNSFNISNSRISCTSKAFFLYGSRNSWGQIKNNIFELLPGLFGIQLESNTNFETIIQNNIISFKGLAGIFCRNNIWAQFWGDVEIYKNNIEIKNGVANSCAIYISNCKNGKIYCNGITATILNNERKGFLVGSSENLQLVCNEVTNCGVGYKFSSENLTLDLLTNTQSNCNIGTHLNENSIIGSQVSKGNVFYGNFYIGSRHDGNDFYIRASRFIVFNSNSVDYPIGNIPIHTPNSTETWYSINGILPQCPVNPNGCVPIPNRLINEIDTMIINWQYGENEWINSTIFYSKKELFLRLKKDTELRQSNYELNSFYNQNISTNIGRYANLEDSINYIYPTDDNLNSDLKINFVQYMVKIDSIKLLDSIISAEGLPINTSYLTVRNSLVLELQIIEGLLQNIQDSLMNIISSTANNLKNQNINLNTSYIFELNEKLVNNILLDMLIEKRNIPNPNELIILAQIANQCSFDGGRGVLQARSLLSYIEDQLQDDELICNTSSNISTLITQSNAESLNIYPNPNSGKLNVILNIGKETANLKLFQINGKFIRDWQLFTDYNSLDLSNMNSGLYFIEICIGEKRLIRKVVINSINDF